MIYCPRCDTPISPDHRCLSRRHFFGILAGAAAAIALPKAPTLTNAHAHQIRMLLANTSEIFGGWLTPKWNYAEFQLKSNLLRVGVPITIERSSK